MPLPKDHLLNIIKSDRNYSPARSAEWFQKKVRELIGSNVSPQKLMRGSESMIVSRFLPGRMYAYVYDAKYKNVLPYWDAFPLMMPYDITATHVYGLNFHYLNYQMRLNLLNRLMVFAQNNKSGDVAYLKFSWRMLKSVSLLAPVQVCVKQYILSNIKSRLIQIPSTDWPLAAMLPSENFKSIQGTTIKEIWQRGRATAWTGWR